MTDSPQTLALTILGQSYRHDMVRQINRETATLKHLNVTFGGGLNVPFVVENSGQVVEYYAEDSDNINFGSDAQAKGTLQWALFRAPVKVSQLALDAAASNQAGPDGNTALWARQVVNSGAALAKMVNQELFAGDGYGGSSNHLAGLNTWCGSLTANIGGIDRSANPYFRPTVSDPGSPTALTILQVRQDMAKIRIASGIPPKLATVSPNVMIKLVTQFENSRRYVQDVMVSGGSRAVLDSGYSVVEVDGCVFYADPDATESSIFYLAPDHMRLEVLPPASSLDLGGFSMKASDGAPLAMRFKWLGDTGASKKASCDISCQLVCDRPNAFGMRKNIDIS